MYSVFEVCKDRRGLTGHLLVRVPNPLAYSCICLLGMFAKVVVNAGLNEARNKRSRLVFVKCFIRILARTLAILTDFFRSFPQSLKANVGVVPQLGYDCFLRNPTQPCGKCRKIRHRKSISMQLATTNGR